MPEIVGVALDIGEQMLICGGEVWRVEESIGRICRAYELARVDVFTITSSIVVTAWSGGETFTQTRRIRGGSTDLHQLDLLNDLSRWICAHTPPLDKVAIRLGRVAERKRYSPAMICGMYALASAAFTPFFGGTFPDAAVAGAIGAVLYFAQAWLKRIGVNPMLVNIICSMMCGLLALTAVRLGVGDNFDKIAIGNIMPLIPGVALTNAIRDMVSGDIMSGMLRLCEALLIAFAIALGFALAIMAMGGV